jgi:UDP-N-acetylmuramoylalanine-D-glutamate ligase
MFKTKNRIVIWGMGREGRAAVHFIHDHGYAGEIIGVDEGKGSDRLDDLHVPHRVIRDKAQIETTLLDADLIIKSPGVSLYHKWLDAARHKNIPITSLFNLWFAANKSRVKTLCVTGTKGKSTTASLLTHCLNALGHAAVTIGNIGVPVTEVSLDGIDYAVVEVSSYQAADFNGAPDVALVTSLFPEHLDWHGSLHIYYRDKLNLLIHAKHRVMDHTACSVAQKQDITLPELVQFNDDRGFHVRNQTIYCGKEMIGRVPECVFGEGA